MKKQIIGLFVFVLITSLVYAIPPIATEFYGTATVNDVGGTPISAGTSVTAYAGGQLCGSFTISNVGYYGLLSCRGDDNYTTNTTEGAVQGQNIIFYIGNNGTTTTGDTVWYEGAFQEVNLQPIIACGNTYCEITESCATCEIDCGACSENATGNETGGGGGEGGNETGGGGGTTKKSSKGGSGGGGGDSSGGGGSGTGTGGTGGAGENRSLLVCIEDWICTEWEPEECPINGFRTRECFDRNACGTFLVRPDTAKRCDYLGTCDDNIKNQDETDVDCGGLECELCDLGESCLFDTDCLSGFCHPTEKICKEPTCDDGIMNQGEEGIDCGGPCNRCPTKLPPYLEIPLSLITFLLRGCGPFPWLILLVGNVVILSIYFGIVYYTRRLEEDRKFQKLDRLQQLEILYKYKRIRNLFMFLGEIILLIICLYRFYFCNISVWIFLVIFGFIPIVIAYLIKVFKYDEARKERKFLALIAEHSRHLKNLISLENDQLLRMEKELIPKIEEVLKNDINEEIKTILQDVYERLLNITKTENLFDEKLEEELTLRIKDILDEKYKEIIESDEKLHSISQSLSLIQKIHEDKKDLYDELMSQKKIENKLTEEASKKESDKSKEKEKDDNKDTEENKKEESDSELGSEKESEEQKQDENKQEGEEQEIEQEEQKADDIKDDEEIEQDLKIEELQKIKEESEKELKEFEQKKSIGPDEEKSEEGIQPEDINTDNLLPKYEELEITPDLYFKFKDGVILKNVKEMIEFLPSVEDDIYNSQVNDYRNDIAEWIYTAYEDEELYDKLKDVKVKEDLISKIKEEMFGTKEDSEEVPTETVSKDEVQVKEEPIEEKVEEVAPQEKKIEETKSEEITEKPVEEPIIAEEQVKEAAVEEKTETKSIEAETQKEGPETEPIEETKESSEEIPIEENIEQEKIVEETEREDKLEEPIQESTHSIQSQQEVVVSKEETPEEPKQEYKSDQEEKQTQIEPEVPTVEQPQIMESDLNNEQQELPKKEVDVPETETEITPDKYFKLQDNTIIKNPQELKTILPGMDENIFSFHVNENKNDFADWIKNVFDDTKTADKIRTIQDKNEMEAILSGKTPVVKEPVKVEPKEEIKVPAKSKKAISGHKFKLKPEQFFKFNNGRILKNLTDLDYLLTDIDYDTFISHVNGSRNEIYDWIKDILEIPDLAEKIKDVKDRMEMADIIAEEINHPTFADKFKPLSKESLQELKTEIEEEIAPIIEEHVVHDIKPEIKKEVKDEIKEEIKSELENEIKYFIDSKYVKQINGINEKKIPREEKEIIELFETNPTPDKYFKMEDGTIIKNIYELSERVKSLDNIIFSHHNNNDKNDFADWIRNVFYNEELYQKLVNVKDKNLFVKILENYINYATA